MSSHSPSTPCVSRRFTLSLPLMAPSVAGTLVPPALAGTPAMSGTTYDGIEWEIIESSPGDKIRGLLYPVSHYKPLPFVAVKYRVLSDTGVPPSCLSASSSLILLPRTGQDGMEWNAMEWGRMEWDGMANERYLCPTDKYP